MTPFSEPSPLCRNYLQRNPSNSPNGVDASCSRGTEQPPLSPAALWWQTTQRATRRQPGVARLARLGTSLLPKGRVTEEICPVNALKCTRLPDWAGGRIGPCEGTASAAVVCLRDILWAFWTLAAPCTACSEHVQSVGVRLKVVAVCPGYHLCFPPAQAP